ncbi:MAG TPA: hypothetical protein VIX14_01235 [Terriglobales bacterium]
MTGLQLQRLGTGVLLVLTAGVVNAGLACYLLRTGRRSNSSSSNPMANTS